LVLGEEPHARRDLRVAEQLRRQRDHGDHQIRLHHGCSDLSLARLSRRHRAVGEHHTRCATFGKLRNDVLQPRKIGVAYRGYSVSPTWIVNSASPAGIIEEGVREDEICAQVRVQVDAESVLPLPAKISRNAMYSEVHLGEPPGSLVGLLPVHGDVVAARSEEHTSELQSRENLVCRLLLEKK